MKHSEQIDQIAAALAKAQGEMKPAVFDKVNPHFRSKYATLASVMDAIKEPLAKNGLAVSQSLVTQGETQTIVTTILHSSGQWLADDGIPLVLDKKNMQGLGSAITYAKRYGVSALLGVVSDDDDDGNLATGKEPPEVKAFEEVSNGQDVVLPTKKVAPKKPETKTGDFL